MSIKYIQDDNGNFYTDENGNLLTVDVSGEGGGQMLYRHDITIVEQSQDLYCIGVTIINTSSESIDTLSKVKNAVGIGKPINATGVCRGDAVYSVYFEETSFTILYHVVVPETVEYATAEVGVTDSISEIGIAGGGSGSGTPLVETTYDELKSLRDGGQLVAGQKYRITDYNCTTTQENTSSAMHQFDIIVEAPSNNTLSENASAIQHGGSGDSGGGSPQFKPEVLADSEGTLVEGAIVSSYYFFEDFNGTTGEQEGYKSSDAFIAYTYLENNDGVVVPVIYKTDADFAIDAPEEFGSPDTTDTFFYDGTMEVDGTTYDKWRKIEIGGDTLTWDGDAKVWALTNVVVTSGGSVSDPYFANCKLSAWEIKYCFDNDKTRFWWAMDGQTIVNLESYLSNGKPLTRQPIFDGSCPAEEYSEYQYAWGTQADVEDDDAWDFVYSKSETLTNGETVFNGNAGGLEVAEVVSGKGVIYYMKDEYGNECPYDFKNIQFKRDDTYYYTFSWVDENNTVKDLSIVGNTELYNDEGQISGCFGNKMGIVSTYYFGVYDDNPTNLAPALNDNVFIYTYSSNDGYFYGCYSNTFGNNCYTNTFGNNCYTNTFGNNCYSNTFGNNCYINTFGDDCGNNIVDNGVWLAQPQPTTGGGIMSGIHIHYGVTGQFTVTRGATYTQDVRTANDVTITV